MSAFQGGIMSDFQVGGQAVIEGVMIRSATHVATAVRKLDKSIVVKKRPYIPLSRRRRLLNIPIVRGFIAFFEMLFLGISSLNFSAEVAAEEADRVEGNKEQGKKPNPIFMVLTVVVALALAVVLFFFLPLWFASILGIGKDALAFNVVAGAIRLSMFVAYVWLISRFKDIRRVFEYHGAEHKTIFAYEAQEELEPATAEKYTTLHPRCGTSFIIIVAMLAIATFAVADTVYQWLSGSPPALLTRFLVHFSLLPLVAGSSYELLKLSGRTIDSPITRILIKPGLWLQKITTREPDLEQLEVAVVAVRASLNLPQQVEVQELTDA
jgi:uncharacterized protein YqhQ